MKIFISVLPIASALLLAACTKKTEHASEVTIPESPDAAIQTVITEFAKGNSGILWKALPATYQNDVNALVHLAGSKIDPEVYDKSFALIARSAEVIDQQQNFILNSSFMQNQSPEDLLQFEAALPSITGLINTLANSELASTEDLLHFEGQTFFDTTVAKCIEYLEAIGQLTGEESSLSDYVNTEVSIVKTGENQATLLLNVPGQEAFEHIFTKIGQRWVPAEMASEWTASIAEATASLEASSNEEFAAQKPQIMSVLTMLDGVLTQIASAETQEQFDQSLKGAMMPLMGLFMIGQGMKE